MTADRTTALDAAQRILKRTKSGYSSEEFGCYLPNDDAPLTARALLASAKEADRMRARLESLAQSIERTAYDCMVGRDNADRALDQVAYRIRAALLPSEGTEPIPSGVYYLADHDNFYRVKDDQGMGTAFYREWRARKAEFPSEGTKT